jgi:FkbM family methyltransferase
MEKNFELNGLTGRIQTFPYGLGDQNSMVRFQFNPINTGASHIDRENSPSSISAEIRTLDSLVSQMDVSVEDRILVKLDAESMEPEAIRGSRGFIRMFPEITFVIEDKFVGRESLTSILDQYAIFEYGRVDRFNIYARKIGNLN